MSEEVYFRGIIPGKLKRAFSPRTTLWISVLLFGLGHGAGALSGAGLAETLLTVVNALIFGVLAMELVMLSGNILPAAVVHFFFDFETKISALDAPQLLNAELVRGGLMFLVTVYLWHISKKEIP